MQAEIEIQTSKVLAANKLIEDIKSEKSAINQKINRAEKDLEAIFDDVKRKLKISVYVENSELFEEVAKIQNQLEIDNLQAGLIEKRVMFQPKFEIQTIPVQKSFRKSHWNRCRDLS